MESFMTDNSISQTAVQAQSASNSVANFNDLRKRVPAYEGEVVLLQCHTAPAQTLYQGIGGGWFIGSLTAAADDGGTVASTDGSAYHWRRKINNLADLTIGDFGAVPDGKTDAIAAVEAMYNFTLNNSDNKKKAFIAIPAGNYAISSLNISSTYLDILRINGPSVSFGYSPIAKLTLIGDESSFAFSTNARRTEVSCLDLYGQYDQAENTRGFMTNKCTSGQYYQCDRLWIRQTGGVVFNMLDTLDTKFNSFYTDQTFDSILRARPSYSTEGSWDHITAIELSNFNVQNSRSSTPAFDLPRATQSCIYNGWMEKCVYPMDISNGQWTIDVFSMEGATVPADITYAMVTMRQINLQKAAFNRNNASVVRYIDAYQLGYRREEAYGTALNGSMAANWYSSNLRFNNTTAAPVWVYVGDYKTTAESDQVTVRFVGARSESSAASGAINNLTNNFGGGEAILRMRRAKGNDTVKPVGAVEVRGSSPVMDIRLNRPYADNVNIYVQLPANSGYVHVQVESTADSRFHNGTCFIWTPHGEVVEDSVVDTLTYAWTPVEAAAFGTLKGNGIAFDTDGTLVLTTKALLEDAKLRMRINGINYRIPLETDALLSDKFSRTGNINGSNVDNKLGGSGTYSWSAGYGGYNTQAGSLLITAKSNTSASLRISLSDFTARFKLVSGPATADSSTPNAGYEFRKQQGGVVDCYRLTLQAKSADGSIMRLVKRVTDAAGTVTHTLLSPADARVADGQTIGVTAKGSSIKVYADSELIWEITDSTFPAGEVIGFFAGAQNSGYELSNMEIFSA